MLAPGSATGTLLYGKTPLSFWGGTDPKTGTIVDTHHDLVGQSFAGKILAVPSARGSCTGSLAILECIMSGNGPAGVILAHPDHIIALGALIAGVLYDKGIPVVVVGQKRYDQLQPGADVRIDKVSSIVRVKNPDNTVIHIRLADIGSAHVELSPGDLAMLRGDRGMGYQKAMDIVVAMARMYGAERLIDVSYAHIDACIYVGPASLRFAQTFEQYGTKFSVPTTLNAVSVDQRRWRELGVSAEEAEPACALADAYISMGASEQSFTCAPYLLPDRPRDGDQIVWAESNAVVYANSVVGARTQKYPDMLDVLVAVTGRAPLAGCHLDEHRLPTLRIDVDPRLAHVQDGSLWPLLGYRVGAEVNNAVPVVCGLEESRPDEDDLKAFSAAFGTTSGSPMFHIRGVTPQAKAWNDGGSWTGKVERIVHLTLGDLAASWKELNSATDDSVGLVAIGNPHASIREVEALADLVRDKARSAKTRPVVTLGRYTHDQAAKAGYLDELERFGADVLTDTCWCMIDRPIVPDDITNIMTTSAKYAHYGPGRTGKGAHFGNLAECIEAAVRGCHTASLPAWLR